MLTRNRLLLSLALPALAGTAILFALFWRRKSKENGREDTAEVHVPNERKNAIVEDNTLYSGDDNSSIQHAEAEECEQDNAEIFSGDVEEDVPVPKEITFEDDLPIKKSDLPCVVEKKTSRDRHEGKKSSWSTIDSGVELTKQPSFEMREYLLGEETLSEGSEDSSPLSAYTETQLDKYLARSCEVSEAEKIVWEVEFPQILCGRLIGRKGKNVKVISDASGAKIRLIPQSPGEVSTHRIISIAGDCSQIKSALDSIHEKFPAVPLNRINAAAYTAAMQQTAVVAPIVSAMPIATPAPYVQTVLPNMANFNVVVTSVLDANHFFIQLHNDTLQAQLQQLHQTMLQCYGQGNGGPLALPLPQPLIVGSYCSAPAFTYDGWYRAQVLGPTGNGDEVQVKYLDYGGFGRIAASSLRQLRSDFLSYLPFQAVECYLSNVAPLNGDGFSLVASAVLEDLTMNAVLAARVLGHRNHLPCLELYLVQGQQTVMINRELVNRGLARWVES